MARIASPYWFRAEGALVSWLTMLRARLAQGGHVNRPDRHALEAQLRDVERRPMDVQLRWSCAERLGVPLAPFTVWMRPPKHALEPVTVRTRQTDAGLVLRLGHMAAAIEVECDVVDPTQAVGLFATLAGASLRSAVAAAAVRAPGGGRVTLRVRCSGANRAVLVNGANPTVRSELLQAVVNDPHWEPLEIVGLPADDPWHGTAYRAGQQGLVSAPVDPATAALQRLERGGPPIGWHLLTETGRLAPPWMPPDFGALLHEVRDELLPRVERIFRPGLVPPHQRHVVDSPHVDSPHSAVGTSSLKATAKLPPLGLLTLPAASEPFLALATGFGTAYHVGREQEGARVPRDADFLVTAEYDETPLGGGPATVAAYVPTPLAHGEMTPPATLTAERDGLVAPGMRDAPWRETVRVSWDRLPSTAALGRASGAVVGKFDAAVPMGPVECLLPVRAAGDFRPLLPMPDGPPGTPGFARAALVDTAAVIPLGSGGRSAGYAVAVQDVFGAWSRWDDVTYTGNEPGRPLPRVLALALSSSFAGSTTCPATLEIEISVDWADRTPGAVDLAIVFFRMATSTSAPPAGTDPTGPAPAGGFRRDLVLAFVGDRLTAPGGVAVDHLDSGGEHVVTPGPLQGQHGRRYRLRVPVPTLDFAATRRWGVQVWARTWLVVFGTPTAWSPGPSRPARASAASPVPVVPLPPPLPPGVPLGSTPDAEGRSHARVRWSLPGGADVQRVIVWEVAETALRQSVGLPARAPEGALPAERLQALWNAYDALPAGRRRAIFRRLQELPGTARDTDVALQRGSTDIHLFTVTTTTSTAVDSPWPDGPTPHEHLQAVMAPRLRRPATPLARATVGDGGVVTVTLTSTSRTPVREFRLFRTRSAAAARSAETMGPAFATAIAVPPPPGTELDPATGELPYTAAWSGAFPASWDEWFVRVVAVPVDEVPVEAVRGLPSPSSEPATITVVPDAGPDLAPLTAEVWGAGHDGVLVRTSTAAPFRAVPLGSHRVSARAGTVALPMSGLEEVRAGETANPAAPPAGASPGPVLVHGPRTSGRTPLGLWFTRPVATDPVEVLLRLADPLGRVIEQTLTVPGWVPPAVPTLELIDVFTIAGRGAVLQLRSAAPIDAQPPYVLHVFARTRALVFPPPPPATLTRPLHAIPGSGGAFNPGAPIQLVRTSNASPFEYQVLVRLRTPFDVRVTLASPDGGQSQVTTSVR
jgi:hypothetical protein